MYPLMPLLLFWLFWLLWLFLLLLLTLNIYNWYAPWNYWVVSRIDLGVECVLNFSDSECRSYQSLFPHFSVPPTRGPGRFVLQKPKQCLLFLFDWWILSVLLCSEQGQLWNHFYSNFEFLRLSSFLICFFDFHLPHHVFLFVRIKTLRIWRSGLSQWFDVRQAVGCRW